MDNKIQKAMDMFEFHALLARDRAAFTFWPWVIWKNKGIAEGYEGAIKYLQTLLEEKDD